MNAYVAFTQPIRAEIIRLTPDKARELLASSRGNRPITSKHVAFLARQIADGRWKLNGEALIVDQSNRLIDGHHRCHAVIKSGAAIDVLTVRNVDSGAFQTINTGRVRSASDVLSISGALPTHFNLAAATARLMLAYKTLPDGITCDAYNSARFDNESIDLEVKSWGNKVDILHAVSCANGNALRRAGTSAAAMLLHDVDAEKSSKWLTGVLTGENLTSTDPRYVYRERIINRGKIIRPTEVFICAMKSARAFLLGHEMKMIRYGWGETFPRLPK